MGLLRRLSLLLALAVLAPAGANAQDADLVRVRLFGTSTPGQITVGGAGTVTIDGRVAGRLGPGASVRVERRGAFVSVTGGVDGQGRTVEVASDRQEELLHVTGGRASVDVHGRLVALAVGSELVVVNHVPMPDYVASVVASEYGFPEIEGVKAQAVLARTYAVRSADARRAYDLDDHQGSQVYRGAGVVTAVAERAERETRGQVLTYAGQPVEAVYSSSSGGHTADNEAVWGTTPVPYLRGVPDPYDAEAPDHEWRTTADAARVHGALSRRYGGHVTGVYVAERSREGRAVRVGLIGSNRPVVSGSDFRTVVNGTLGWRTLRSTRFDVSLQGSQYVFDGRGFGHGVGMSQYGARGQARAGRSYLDILAYYFQGTEVHGAPPASRPPAYASARPVALPPSAPPVAPVATAPPRGRGEAFVVRDTPPVATTRPAEPTAQPSPPSADGRRWPAPRRTRAAW